MIKPANRVSEDGVAYCTYDVCGACLTYEYYYSDISDDPLMASILDDILSRNCIPAPMADFFAVHFVNFADLWRQM
ncbi:MAG: hypothetical protein IJ766_04630 [Clostridia bacterium]|nr:hypothetical protein [Clostridia bacterium]